MNGAKILIAATVGTIVLSGCQRYKVLTPDDVIPASIPLGTAQQPRALPQSQPTYIDPIFTAPIAQSAPVVTTYQSPAPVWPIETSAPDYSDPIFDTPVGAYEPPVVETYRSAPIPADPVGADFGAPEPVVSYGTEAYTGEPVSIYDAPQQVTTYVDPEPVMPSVVETYTTEPVATYSAPEPMLKPVADPYISEPPATYSTPSFEDYTAAPAPADAMPMMIEQQGALPGVTVPDIPVSSAPPVPALPPGNRPEYGTAF